MPKTLGIPQQLHRPLKSLLEVSPSLRAAVIAALTNAGTKSSPDELVPLLTAVGVSQADAVRIITALVSMYGAREDIRLPVDQFVERLLLTAQEFPEQVRPNVADWAGAGEFLKHILTLHGTLGATVKSVLLRAQQPNAFAGSQIVTDLRPIYLPDADAPPVCGIVVHTLRISSRDGDDVYVVMDNDDLQRLRDDIDRAIKKERSMRGLFTTDRFIILEEPDGSES